MCAEKLAVSPSCPACGDVTRYVRTIWRGTGPDLHIYRCNACNVSITDHEEVLPRLAASASALPIATAPKNGRTVLLWCPEQGGWQSGEWCDGAWISLVGNEVIELAPRYWMPAPAAPE